MAYKIRYAGFCIQGLVRKKNEDNIWCLDHCLPILHIDEERKLSGTFKTRTEQRFAVFDGIGGGQSGEIASYLAARTFGDSACSDPELLSMEMNQAILEHAEKNRIGDIGSTAVGILFGREAIKGFNLGDSRCYRFSGGELKQLSIDHVTPEELFRSGKLTRSLGMPKNRGVPKPAVFDAPYRQGDTFLLCSDGLTKLVSDRRITMILREKLSIREKLTKIKDVILRKGAVDNTTVLLFEVEQPKILLSGLL